jgi:nucleoside-diphosphate kinase
MERPEQETTILLVKPDGVKRGLVGEVLKRVESRGLKIIAAKMINASREHAHSHYPQTDEWLRGMGEKTLDNYRQYGKDPKKEVGTDDPLEIGKQVSEWNVDFLTSGPMVAVAVRGIHAVDMVRKIVGKTIPAQAEMGTIPNTRQRAKARPAQRGACFGRPKRSGTRTTALV